MPRRLMHMPMRWRRLLPIAGLLPALFAQSSAPDATEQRAIIERARAAALEYSNSLKDFTCTRLMTRSADDSSTGKHYKRLDTQEGELSYVNHRETYQARTVNGQTTGIGKLVKKGYFIPGGEFGAYLLKIFEPNVNAEFAFDHNQTSGDRALCIFRYYVPLAATTMGLVADGETYPLAHHGQIVVDRETGVVMRFHIESDKPTVNFKGHKIVVGNDLDVRYGLTMIGDKQFLLPQEAIEVNRFDKRLTKVEIEFRQYRKYDSTSTVTFEPGK